MASGEREDDHGCAYINEYCHHRHKSVVSCSWTEQKGRILRSEKAFRPGEVIFREPPLHIVAERVECKAFQMLRGICASEKSKFDYEPLWYWTALCSLRRCEADEEVSGLSSIDDDKQRKLLLLYHPDVREPSAASKRLVDAFSLGDCLDPLKLDRVLQVWILNCFEHTDDPLGYSTYFMSSFMSHSCGPNAVWHYDGDDFILRARDPIKAGDEISVSYLSEEALLESVPSRQAHLQSSKHFKCTCARCSAECDMARGFRCPECSKGHVFGRPARGRDDGAVAFEGVVCKSCARAVAATEATHWCQEEAFIAGELDRLQRRLSDEGPASPSDASSGVSAKRARSSGRGGRSSAAAALEAVVQRAEKELSQHWLLDKAWSMLTEVLDRTGRPLEAETMMQKRIAYQAGVFPFLSGCRAWTLEGFADMVLTHAGNTSGQQLRVASKEAALKLEALATPAYREALDILRLMFGNRHEYVTAVEDKHERLQAELDRWFDLPPHNKKHERACHRDPGSS